MTPMSKVCAPSIRYFMSFDSPKSSGSRSCGDLEADRIVARGSGRCANEERYNRPARLAFSLTGVVSKVRDIDPLWLIACLNSRADRGSSRTAHSRRMDKLHSRSGRVP